ncbi:acylphosphatase [Candidatus Bathyarchaeota archaeon]|nr:acylphosphatase [Candidatus Bathyarchaeota archaeon]
MALKVRAHLYVSGLVQGVFFRWQTKKAADKHNVKGWVRNLRVGKVEAVLEGEAEAVKKVIDFCSEGPSHAKVKQMQVEWQNYKNEFHNFSIKNTL